MAAMRGHLDRLVRLWYLGTGVGYGRYPIQDGIWENGHTVVSLDPKERFCGCGGSGHLEGVMGFRSMRLRFMDLEPDEVFEQAQAGETRCVEFVKLWHRALAAGTASSIHVSGPGKFFITGPGARYVNLSLLSEYMQEMVKLSPLQSYSFEIVPGGEDIAPLVRPLVLRKLQRLPDGRSPTRPYAACLARLQELVRILLLSWRICLVSNSAAEPPITGMPVEPARRKNGTGQRIFSGSKCMYAR